jgi:hypothetical protein
MKSFRLMATAMLVVMLGCAGAGDEAISWEEFQARVYTEPDTGVMIINGDEAHENLAQLAETYWRYIESFDDGIGTTRRPSIVNRVNGKDDVWSTSIRQNITYCIKKGSYYNATKAAMDSATQAWESATGGGINFVHLTSQDSNCTNRNNNVVFNVRTTNTNQYLARAFFPSYSRRSREVIFAAAAYGNISPWTLAGVARHELGHTIGLRHEHTRPEAGTCFENNSWRALTTYDSASVMHYPQCNGTNNGDLVLTNLDKQGAAALY